MKSWTYIQCRHPSLFAGNVYDSRLHWLMAFMKFVILALAETGQSQAKTIEFGSSLECLDQTRFPVRLLAVAVMFICVAPPSGVRRYMDQWLKPVEETWWATIRMPMTGVSSVGGSSAVLIAMAVGRFLHCYSPSSRSSSFCFLLEFRIKAMSRWRWTRSRVLLWMIYIRSRRYASTAWRNDMDGFTMALI